MIEKGLKREGESVKEEIDPESGGITTISRRRWPED